MKHPRFRVRPFRSNAMVRYFLIATVSLFIISIFLGFSAFAVAFVLGIAFAIVAHIDTKSKINSTIEELEISGMIPCEIEDLDHGFLENIQSAKPYPVRTREIKACVTGSLDEREVVYIIFTKDINDEETYFIGCSVWSPVDWPPTTIRLRSPLIDLFIGAKKIGAHTFDKRLRLVSTQSEQIAAMLRSLVHWFPETNDVPKSFRMSPLNVTYQQWRLDGNWVFFCDTGDPSTENLTRLGEHLVGFTIDAEEFMDSNESY